MRIVLDDWTYSIEFEGTTLKVENACLYAKMGKEYIKLAQYESEGRATEVMYEMHRQWAENPLSVYELPEV